MRLARVTLTGVDNSVHPVELCRLHTEFPFVEFGVLLSEKREGREPRYPTPKWIDNIVNRVNRVVPFSGHLCGRWCRDAIEGPFLWAIERNAHFDRFERIQFNGPELIESTINRVAILDGHFENKEFILQAKSFERAIGSNNHAISRLLDHSGGLGIELTEFPAPSTSGHCGYAGGFGPSNLRSVLEKLTAMPGDPSIWVDMESSLRTEHKTGNIFDVDKAYECLKIAAEFIAN